MIEELKKLFREVLIEVLTEFGFAARGNPVPASQTPVEPVKEKLPTAAEKAAPPQAPSITREQVGVALVQLATQKGRDAAVAVLASFGAQKLDDVPAANYGKLLEAINTAALV